MIKKIFIKIIGVYQYFISPFLGSRCLFYPTCSEYAKQSIEKHGIIRSSWSVFVRILSCHPFSKKKYWDPIK